MKPTKSETRIRGCAKSKQLRISFYEKKTRWFEKVEALARFPREGYVDLVG